MKQVIATTKAPAAIGPYSQAILVGDMLFASGQLGIDPATGEFPEGVTAQTEQVFRNIHAILAEAGFTIDQVVKTTCFLADKQFTGTFPARSAVAVKTLPKNGLVEIEIIAHRG